VDLKAKNQRFTVRQTIKRGYKRDIQLKREHEAGEHQKKQVFGCPLCDEWKEL